MSLGWHRLAEFNNVFPFLDHPDEIDKITSGRLWNPGMPESSFLAWLVYYLRPLGGIGEGLIEFFPGAAQKHQDFSRLLKDSLMTNKSLADRVDCEWSHIRGFGGDRQIVKKIIASYFPEQTLPVFKTGHLERFARDLGADINEECRGMFAREYGSDEISVGQKWQLLTDILLARKIHHTELAQRDNAYYMGVLYFSPPTPLRSLLKEPWSDTDSGSMPLTEWIAKEESEILEFKSTLRVNVHTGQPDRNVEGSVVKTVVAFANSFGGTLLVGVSDNRQVVGIRGDMESLHSDSLDAFRVHLRNLLSGSLGADFAPYASDSYEELHGAPVCVVTVRRRRKAATWYGNILYIRDGPTSRPLEGPEAAKYIEEHFRR